MKPNFEGHNKRSTGNLHAFASVYGDHCLNGINQISDEFADGYANNMYTCVLAKPRDSWGPTELVPSNNKNISVIRLVSPGQNVQGHVQGRCGHSHSVSDAHRGDCLYACGLHSE